MAPSDSESGPSATSTAAATSSVPVISVLLPAETYAQVVSADAARQLAAVAQIRYPPNGTVGPDDVGDLLDGAVACLTGWGTPPLTEAVLVEHPSLKLVAHTAGSIRRLLPPSALENGIQVTHAAGVIADAVAELVISEALLGARRLHEIDRRFRAGDGWFDLRTEYPGHLLGAQTIGIVGAGYVGRIVIRLFKAFGCQMLVYDPTLTDDEAADLGVESRGLDELFAESDVVSLHAPVLPETRGMIGARQFGRLRDGAFFINTARAALIDEAALLAELRTGRIAAGLDVFDQEPLPPDSAFRGLTNVVLSPHVAGHSIETHLRQGQAMVDEIGRFIRGETLQYRITPAMLRNMA